MKRFFKSIFTKSKEDNMHMSGLTRLIISASPEERKRIYKEAARKADEDQRKLFKRHAPVR